MFKIILSRFLQGVIALVSVLTLTFFLCRLTPGNPFDNDKQIPEHIRAKIEEAWGLDQPLVVQWGKSLLNAAQGFPQPSFGNSGFSVREIIAQSFPVSFTIAVFGMLIALAIGVPAGVISASRRNTGVDYSIMSLALFGICLPTFVIGPMLAIVFGLELGWFPALGWGEPADLVLPCVTLGLFYGAYIARLSRSGMLDTLSQDFIRTAKAKGLPEWRILIIHALRGGLIPVVNYLGPAFAGLISGSFVVETIFNMPGLGTHFINAAGNRDYSLIQGTVAVLAVLILVANFLADVLQILLNPRLRGGSAETKAAS